MAWDAATGKLVHHEEGLPGYFPKIALSPDGASLGVAMGIADPPKRQGCTEIRLYSGTDWKLRRRWQAHDGDDVGRCSIVFSPDGKTIATGGADGEIRRWDAVTGKEIGNAIDPCQKHCQDVTYLDAGTLVTFGFQQIPRFWDATTGKPKLEFAGSDWHVTALAYSPDDRHVAVGGGDGPIRLWDAVSGKQVALLRDGMSDVTCLHFSPDSRWIVSGDSGGQARLWDWAKGGAPIKAFPIASRRCIPWLSVPTARASRPATSPAPSVCGRFHRQTGPANAPGSKVPGLRLFSRVSALAFTADGKTLFSGSSGQGIRHWDLATGKQVRLIGTKSLGHTNAVSGLAISPSGRWGYSCGYDGSICVWEAGSGRPARVLKGPEPGYNGPVPIALSHDGTRLAAAFGNDWDNPSVHLWDLTNPGKVIALAGHRAPVTRLAFSPDGRRLASGSATRRRSSGMSPGSVPVAKVPDDKALASALE